MRKMFLLLAVALLLIGPVTSSNAAPVQVFWTDWTAATAGTPGSATGTIALAPTVSVAYSGDLLAAQLNSTTNVGSPGVATGVNYWSEPATPLGAYTGNAFIANAPTAFEYLALSAPNSTNTFTFTGPVTNPLMAIMSLGNTSGQAVSYIFSSPFTVVSSGAGVWGNGPFSISGNTLTGNEFNGVIELSGTFSSFTFTTSSAGEAWSGVTVGAVPIPAAAWLLGTGLVGLVAIRRKRK